MSNSKDIQNANSGCFSSILRRLLCSDSVPTHPFDSYHTTKESDPAKLSQSEKIKEARMVSEGNVQNRTNNPGIVARLMGLDTLPAVDTDLGLNGHFPDLVTRSRSVNFMDYLLKQQSDMTTTRTLPHHRRLKTSVSFREKQEKNSQQLFVLFLNNTDETNKIGPKPKSSQGDFAELKNNKMEERGKKKKSKRNKALVDQECKKVTRMKNASRKVSNKHFSCSSEKDPSVVPTRKKNFDRHAEAAADLARSPLKTIEQKEVSAESKLMKHKKKKKNQKTENKSSSASSSADSVLDVNDFLLYYETELSEYNQSMDLDSMRYTSTLECAKTSDTGAKELQASKKGKSKEMYTELVDKLVRLTEEDITKLNWVSTRMPIRFEEYEDICVELGQDILNLLLQQLVDEIGFHAKAMSSNA